MNCSAETRGPLLVLMPNGRLDAFGANELDQDIQQRLTDDIVCVTVDMIGVRYLSSAGLRTLMALGKRLAQRGGALALANVQGYCRSVIDIAGCAAVFPIFESAAEAVAHCGDVIREQASLDEWDGLEEVERDCGEFRIIPAGDDEGGIEILGHIRDVLYARITPAHLCSKRFYETEYSIGLGGLGDQVDDYFGIMGEMITIGGTMVWLPTDGHDTPDFLIPRTDTGEVTLRTAFNASISGGFNELTMFDSAEENGTAISALYRALFAISKTRRDDYRGIIGIAVRAQMASVFGSGVTKSPVEDIAPANGEMIIDKSNIAEWFDCDSAPRHTDVTCLISGIGADLTVDLSAYDEEQLNSVFYMHPANVGGKTELLHNHGVIFTELPMPDRAANLEKEIKAVVEQGDFLDMRHLLDSSTVRRALIGVSYTQTLRRDPRGTILNEEKH